ncbi:antitoxin VbhA family protein [Achromobacter sp. 413638]|uniref:antitoxin VbhA family protein n=1 Tax=Achromobacter sp. 413638 TaxID=3342385 RepID=UPI003255C5E5
MKESTVTFRVETELRDDFHRAVETEHRPAAQVLRELMREYIVRTLPPKSLITAAERQRRQAAVEFSRANVGLEGFVLTPADEVHAQRFIDGEIDLAEFVAAQLHDQPPSS